MILKYAKNDPIFFRSSSAKFYEKGYDEIKILTL